MRDATGEVMGRAASAPDSGPTADVHTDRADSPDEASRERSADPADPAVVDASLARSMSASGPESRDRTEARASALRLIQQVQAGVSLSAGAVRALVVDADDRGWPDVAIAAIRVEIHRSEAESGRPDPQAITELLERAQTAGDVAMPAFALATRARVAMSFGSPSPLDADGDLARAAVMLDGAADTTLDTAAAHVACARAYDVRDLWELELEHYSAPDREIRDEDSSLVLPVLRFNQAETHLHWLMSLREMSETDALTTEAAAVATALRRADMPTMPDSWRHELRIAAQVLAAIAPSVAEREWLAIDLPADGAYAGHVHLARALSAREPHDALAHARAAVSTIDPVLSRCAHNLALCVRAEVEQALVGRDAAALQYARRLTRLRWDARVSALAAARARRGIEHLRSEHAILSKHAYLDDLTGLGNRRALNRHVQSLVALDIRRVVIVAIDFDHFKAINDTHGHAIGDETLIRVADILRAAVRSGDLAVRVGGDEFLLVLAGTNIEVACERVQTILARVASAQWDQLSHGLHVTLSAGAAAGDPTAHDTILAAADAALYRAKSSGGNTVHT